MSEPIFLSVRRRILQYLVDDRPIGLDYDDLAGKPAFSALGIPRQDIVTECLNLESYGFIKNAGPAHQPLWMVAPDGLRQINKEGRLDRRIWGKAGEI